VTARETCAAVTLFSFATAVKEPVSTTRTNIRILLTISDILFPHGESTHFFRSAGSEPTFLNVLPLSGAV
jgi:hypothetical protein